MARAAWTAGTTQEMPPKQSPEGSLAPSSLLPSVNLSSASYWLGCTRAGGRGAWKRYLGRVSPAVVGKAGEGQKWIWGSTGKWPANSQRKLLFPFSLNWRENGLAWKVWSCKYFILTLLNKVKGDKLFHFKTPRGAFRKIMKILQELITEPVPGQTPRNLWASKLPLEGHSILSRKWNKLYMKREQIF